MPRVTWRTNVVRKQMLWQDHAVDADKGIGPVRRRICKPDANGEIVDFLDLDVLVAADRDSRRLGHSRIFPDAEDDVIGRERLSVMPLDAALQLPHHRAAVFRETIVLLAGNFGGQRCNQIAFGVPSRQRLVEDPGAFLILGSDSEMRVEQSHRLPIEQLQHATAAGPGRLVGDFGRGHRHSGLAQHHSGHRCRQADGDHLLEEGSLRDSRPRLTSAMRSRSCRSFIGRLPSWCSILHRASRWPCRHGGLARLEMDQDRTILSKQDLVQSSAAERAAAHSLSVGSIKWEQSARGDAHLCPFYRSSPRERQQPRSKAAVARRTLIEPFKGFIGVPPHLRSIHRRLGLGCVAW